MPESPTTDERILNAFLLLVTERGLAATTTKALAEAAGVNEVTIFRRFKDKEALVHALFRYVDLAGHIRACPRTLEIATSQNAADEITRVMVYLRNVLRDHASLVQFGIGEYRKFPTIWEESVEAPQAARDLLGDVLRQLHVYLRPEVDLQATTLSLMGLLLLTVLWSHTGLFSVTEEQWDATLAAAIHPLIAWEKKG